MTRMLAARMAVALALALVACGRREDPGDADPWPLQPGVLAYAATRSNADDIERWTSDAIGWSPRGLRSSDHVIALHLDPTTFGGQLALAIPVDDDEAFLSSLEACPAVGRVDERWSLTLPPENPLNILQALLTPTRSPVEMMQQALERLEGNTHVFDVELEGGYAFVVPAFEAFATSRRFVDNLRRSDVDMVVSLDIELLATAYREQIKAWEGALRTGGRALPMLGAMSDEGFSIDWDLVEALRRSLELDKLRAVQFQGTLPRDLDGVAALSDVLEGSLLVRVAYQPGATATAIVGSLRAAPPVEDAGFAVAADPEAFAAALERWFLPLAEFLHGRGEPSRRHAEELGELTASWRGLMAIDDDAIVATWDEFDVAAWAAWLRPLLEQTSDTTVELRGDRIVLFGETTTATIGTHEGTIWMAAGSAPETPVASCEKAAQAGPATGPGGLEVDANDAVISLSASGDELRFAITDSP